MSFDGGANWQGKNAIKDSTGMIISTVGNPKIAIDKNGTFLVSYIAPNSSGGNAFKVGISYSTNNGNYWSRTVYIPGVDSADKPVITTDDIPSSPYFGNSYVVYNDRSGIQFSRTTNSGKTWAAARKISPPVYWIRTGAFVTVGQSGEIYVTWPYLKDSQKYIGFAKSTDGGLSWDSTDTGIPVFPLKSDFRINLNLVKLNGLPSIAVDNSSGIRNGWIYVASCERQGAGNQAQDSCDVILRCSSDHGLTWPMTYRVNQDSGTYHYQIFPAITIDKTGGINVLYYDTRNTPGRDSFQVYLSRSEDGGQTFQDLLISDHKFKLKQMVSSKWVFAIPSYIGTGIGIASSAKNIIPFWFDNSADSDYQAFTSVISIKQKSFIKVIPQGFLDLSNQYLNSKDTIRVYLRRNNSPYAVIDSAMSVIDSVTFTSELNFINAGNGNYYINIIHRNSIEVWSKNPVYYSEAFGLNYNFTDSSTKAYGNNLQLNQNYWCLYSGDTDQDGIIDLSDISNVENSISNSVEGYVSSDLNGDGTVDSSDMMLAENNSSNSIMSILP
ncbi:MAG TPA: hypothetical protein PKD83_11910 [Ignavibacteria bacterium]|nr:hypothetical protein [Ignavibacteria bacterium]